ncbi:DUF1643 domain-containing protein [Synechococcus sp. CBW1108]|nr:DUF1643 domain-containing protein [Synechococcus sp. CBW1108]
MGVFAGLNPSCADKSIKDPAIQRCVKSANELGIEGVYPLNAYAFRATRLAT